MNFRKFISGISALTIAATAFASMAVVANAAELVEIDYIGSSTQVISEPTTEGWTDATTTTIVEVAKPEVGETAGEPDSYYYPTYVSGTVLRNTQRKNTVTSEYKLPAAIKNGTVTFKANVMTSSDNPGYYDGGQIQLRNSSGEAVATIVIPNGTGRLSLNGKYDNSYTVAARAGALGFNVNLVVDIGSKKVTAIFDTITSEHKRVANSTVTADITVDPDIASLALYQTSTRSSNSTYLDIDDIQFYANTIAAAAETVKISFKADEAEVANKTIDIASQAKSEGEEVSYFVPAYVEGTDGNIYKVNSNYGRKTAAQGAETTVTENVTLVENAVQYEEFDGSATYVNRDEYASNGQVASGEHEITVDKDGVYTLTVSAGINLGGSTNNRNYNLTVKDGATIAENHAVSGYVEAQRYESISLKAGDTIVFQGSDSHVALDYILFVKTGDITPVEPQDHDEAFTFEKTASELGNDAKVHVVFKNDTTSATKDYSEDLGTSFSGAGDAKIAVVIANIANGYSVKSIVIK